MNQNAVCYQFIVYKSEFCKFEMHLFQAQHLNLLKGVLQMPWHLYNGAGPSAGLYVVIHVFFKNWFQYQRFWKISLFRQYRSDHDSKIEIDGLMQKRRNSSANTLELHPFCIQLSRWYLWKLPVCKGLRYGSFCVWAPPMREGVT